jgi:hypothetical protein
MGSVRGTLSVSVAQRVWVAGGSLVTLRNWVTVGPRGVSFRSWFRRREYAWATIESFEVGNPAEPRFAYIIVRVDANRVEAVRLPAFNSIAPAELAETLRQKQRAYSTGVNARH